MTRPEGFEVPLHRSLVEPMLLAGLPRTVARATACAGCPSDTDGSTATIPRPASHNPVDIVTD
jgi:hypothetical protein